MRYFLIEGKFKTFSYSLENEGQEEVKSAFEIFIKKGMDDGCFLIFGGRAHGVIGIGKAENLDDMLSKFEEDPLTKEDVVDYRIAEIEDPIISEQTAVFFK